MEGEGGVGSLAEAVEDFVGDAVARAARDHVVGVDVEPLRNLDAVPIVFRLLHVQLAACGSQDRGNHLVISLDRTALSSKRIHQHLDALLALRGSICAAQQLFNPCLGELAVWLV